MPDALPRGSSVKHVLGFIALLFVGACLEKGGRPLPDPVNPALRELQGQWAVACESWGSSEDAGSSLETMTFSRDRVVASSDFSQKTGCGAKAARLETVMNITDAGTGDYPRPIDMKYVQLLGTIYHPELLAEANSSSDCGVWELGVAKDFAECKSSDGSLPLPNEDMTYQIYGISDHELRFGLVEWNEGGDVLYDGTTPERRPRVLSDHEVYTRVGAAISSNDLALKHEVRGAREPQRARGVAFDRELASRKAILRRLGFR